MKNIITILFSAVMIFAAGCTNTKSDDQRLYVVSTTTMVHDLVQEIGGEFISADGLMGAGVDPHLYKASESDVNKLYNADVIFYSGLHLEGKLVDVFEKMQKNGKPIFAVTQSLDKGTLLDSEDYENAHDPHVWFDINLWRQAAHEVAAKLSHQDPKHKEFYGKNLEIYLVKLDLLEVEVNKMIEAVPFDQRVLITAHDAFNYFGRAYGFEVVGLQGISTAAEAGVKDVQNLATMIVEQKIKAVFVESSVPKRNIEALQEAVKAQGFDLQIGGELFSDALGNAGTIEGTYIGMFRHNVKTITEALK